MPGINFEAVRASIMDVDSDRISAAEPKQLELFPELRMQQYAELIWAQSAKMLGEFNAGYPVGSAILLYRNRNGHNYPISDSGDEPEKITLVGPVELESEPDRLFNQGYYLRDGVLKSGNYLPTGNRDFRLPSKELILKFLALLNLEKPHPVWQMFDDWIARGVKP